MNGNHQQRTVPMIRHEDTDPTGEHISQLKKEIVLLTSQSTASLELSVDRIRPLQLPANIKQPRLYFDPKKMELLKDSIRKYGVLEPILVRPRHNNFFEIISGERRWRCCQELQLSTMPGIVREMPDSVALEAALIAHLLNEEISPVEQTESILSLFSLRLNIPVSTLKILLYQLKNSQVRGIEKSCVFTPEQIDTIHDILNEFGMKLASFVSNRLPLLNLAPEIMDLVRQGKLSPTNAVLINRQSKEFHSQLIAQAEGKTKRELVALIQSKVESVPPPSKQKSISDQIYRRIDFVRKQPELLEKPEIFSRLKKINSLLQEIESFSH